LPLFEKELPNRKPAWTRTWLEKALDAQRVRVLAARMPLLMPSLTWVAQSGCRTLRGPAFELHVVTDRKGDKPHYIIIADDLTHGLNERINYSDVGVRNGGS
jgi:hypothetical protein